VYSVHTGQGYTATGTEKHPIAATLQTLELEETTIGQLCVDVCRARHADLGVR
jgi:hypothetical protein